MDPGVAVALGWLFIGMEPLPGGVCIMGVLAAGTQAASVRAKITDKKFNLFINIKTFLFVGLVINPIMDVVEWCSRKRLILR